MNAVLAWIVSFMVAAAPPGRSIYVPEAEESMQETHQRYEEIASAIAEVAYDPEVKPLFSGPDGRSQTVAVILSVMLHESAFRRHIDYGIGPQARGDHGNSWCLMQIRVGSRRTMRWNIVHDRPARWGDEREEIFEGYSGPELVQDRSKCIREGLKIARLSFGECRKLPQLDWLRAYASGSCSKGGVASAARMGTAMRWFSKTRRRRGFADDEITSIFNGPSPEEPMEWLRPESASSS